ncbi:aminopeptidase N-like isoform X2 [Cataglyphis hispanica]|uniref:aminopeptidase N-like isoform X2 n=1 Tax=Cataglyphis hispanica TaxID=1086592 RepID=UPI0021802028|nr:aminopeptidase N-like isoform X2 [Cataglyphis hispanica]
MLSMQTGKKIPALKLIIVCRTIIKTKIKILHPTQNIRLHAHSYVIIRQTMLIKKINTKTVYIPIKYEYHDKTNILTFYFDCILSRENYILDIKFESISNNEEVFYKTSYINEKEDKGWLVVSHFKAIGARRMFPCWDEPKFRAVFRITIFHHKNYIAQSNMPLQKRLETKNHMIRSVFRITPAMPTYLVAVMISDYNGNPYANKYIKKIANIWCRQLSGQYMKFARNVAKDIKQHFNSTFELKSSKKNLIVKHIVIPGFQDDGMENWGLIFYRETDIMYSEKIDTLARKIEVASLVARKMAHQWFGNLVSPSWWSYLWLNDGIATLLGIDAIDKILPNSRILDLFVVQVQHESLHLDTHLIMKPLISQINSPSKINSFSRYIKVPAILRMLQHILTIDVFQEGLNIYFNNHMFESATPNDLWTAMQTALDKSPFKEYTFNVSRKMAAWLKTTYYPVVKVEQDNPKHVIVWLEKFDIKNEDWWIPVTITTQTKSNFSQNFLPHGQWIKSQNLMYCEFFLPYEENGWIIANLQQAGYYRVNYDSKNWNKIADYLKSPKYTEIHVLNRAQIIDDAFHFMVKKQLPPSIFWKLTNYLWKEKDYIAWYPMIKAFERISSIFSLPEERTERITRKILPMLDDILLDVEYDDLHDSNHTKSLKEEIAKWACILDVRECIHMAKEALVQHLKYPKQHKILPWWKEWTYCNGLKKASDSTWTDMLHFWQETRDDIILKSLTCSDEFRTIQVFLTLIGRESSVLNLHLRDRINTYFFIIAKHARKNEVLDEILKSLKKVKPRKISTVAVLTYIINHVNSKEHFSKISRFVSKNMQQLNPSVQRKIELRQSEIKHQMNYLRSLQKMEKIRDQSNNSYIMFYN